MADYLAAHSDVFMAKKEMHVFGSDLRFGAHFYRRDLKVYLEEFSARTSQRVAGEASVWYLLSTQAAAEIKAFNPDARIVIMLREPVEVLYSLYYQFLCDGNEHLPSFEEALAAEGDRQAGRRIARTTYFAQGLAYRKIVGFTEQIQRYFEVFGRERVHVVIYDDFAADPATAFRNTLEFLGADTSRIRTQYEIKNANKRVRSPALRIITGDPLLRSTVIGLRRWLPRFVFNGLQRAEAQLSRFNTRLAKRPALSPALRARLQLEFAPEVERLSRLLGRDLTHWSRERRLTDDQFADQVLGASAAAGIAPRVYTPEKPGQGIRTELSAP
jgi:hypothetical protein